MNKEYSFDGSTKKNNDQFCEAVVATRNRSSSYKAVQYALSSLYAIDDFTKEFLTTGFYSKIYKVTHKQTGETFVLKLNARSENKNNMLNEVQLMNRLRHGNILRYIGACVHQGQLHALTEYIEGGSLEELIASTASPFPWNRRVSLSRDISNGMCYLHSNRIMHRDLTSKNILIDCSMPGCAKAVICDLGLATKIPEVKRKLSVVGSPWWMAPECIHGELYDEKSDVFSFGIIMCEITSRLPSDPDFLPRTQNFGLDYVAFSHMVHDCPLAYLKLAFLCCQIDSSNRPCFELIYNKFNCLTNASEMANVLQEYGGQDSNFTDMTKPTALYVGMGLKRNNSQHQLQLNYEIYKTNDLSGDFSLKNLMTPKSINHKLKIMDEITPSMIGEQMSQTDQYYQPCRSNPFIKRFNDLGVTKILDANSINQIRFPFTAGHEKKRSNSLPTSPSNHSLSHGSMVSDSDYSDEMNATSESLYSSDSCFTNRDQRYECAAAAAAAAATANDLALSCTTRKQKFRDVMTSWKRSSLTPSTMSIASPPPHSHLEMKSWARVQEIRNVWEERLLNLAATEAKHRDERLTI